MSVLNLAHVIDKNMLCACSHTDEVLLRPLWLHIVWSYRSAGARAFGKRALEARHPEQAGR